MRKSFLAAVAQKEETWRSVITLQNIIRKSMDRMILLVFMENVSNDKSFLRQWNIFMTIFLRAKHDLLRLVLSGYVT